MILIRNGMRGRLAIGCAGALFLALAGCQFQQKTPAPEALNATPIKTDQAMAHRNWAPVPAYYQNDSVMTWPDYAPLQPKPLPYDLGLFMEPVLFLGNVCYIPAGVFLEPGWQEQIYKSMSCPPSYTLMPPLPVGPEPTPQ
ncbi:MAG TPA: hypothetical protein VHX86_15310 [Tepidisphaeraceae bacterium]|jgi:hypothetical protein|nr:hypothetical protein [Tepidisphaeraceae bacterium]